MAMLELTSVSSQHSRLVQFASNVPAPERRPISGELQPKLPPSARDFSVFRRVALEGKSTRDAAWMSNISQTRVCQIVKRVREWLWQVAPDAKDEPPTERLLQMAKYLAADRLEHLYSELMHCWENSAGETEFTRRVGTSPMVISSRSKGKDPRYSVAASRLMLIQARLGLPHGILIDAQAAIPDDGPPERNPFDCPDGELDPRQPVDPPAEECSQHAGSEPQATHSEDPGVAPNGSHAETSVSQSTGRPSELRQKPDPVQRLARRKRADSITDVKVAAESAGVAVAEHVDRLGQPKTSGIFSGG